MLFVRVFCVCFVSAEGIVRLVVRMFRRMLFVARERFANFFANLRRRRRNVFFVYCGSGGLVVLRCRRFAARILGKRLAGKRLEARSERTRIGMRFKTRRRPKLARRRRSGGRDCRCCFVNRLVNWLVS